MAGVPFHFTTAASTNIQPVRAGQTANFKGFSAANVATANWLKLYWYTPTAAAQAPVVGTTVPNFTIGLIVSGQQQASWPDGITGEGQLWVAVTGAAADSDASNAAAGAVISLLVE
jgi:hypothetical protein